MNIVKRITVKMIKSKRLLSVAALLILLVITSVVFLVVRSGQVSQDDGDGATSVLDPNSYTAKSKDLILNATVPEGASAELRSAHEQNIASDLIKNGDKAGALLSYNRALALTPQDAGLLLRTAELAEKLQDPRASEYYQKTFSLVRADADRDSGSFPPATYLSVADIALKAKDNASAKTYYQKTIDAAKSFPGDDEALACADAAKKAMAKL